jgi:hypothetical protein
MQESLWKLRKNEERRKKGQRRPIEDEKTENYQPETE